MTTTTSGGSSDGPSCTATYRNSQAWPGGFQGEVTVTAGDSAVKNWTVSWTTGSGESIIYAWNTSLTTSGTSVTAKSVAYNAALAAGGSVTFGFVANGSSSAPALSGWASFYRAPCEAPPAAFARGPTPLRAPLAGVGYGSSSRPDPSGRRSLCRAQCPVAEPTLLVGRAAPPTSGGQLRGQCRAVLWPIQHGQWTARSGEPRGVRK